MNYKTGDLVSFWTIVDNSARAIDLYDVEPQNDWFETIIYPYEIYGEISKSKGIITVNEINKKGEKTGEFWFIENNQIEGEMNKLLQIKNNYNLTLKEIFEESEVKTKKDFAKIKKIESISLDRIFKKKCCTFPPKKSNKIYSIWEIKVSSELNSYIYEGQAIYDGVWKDPRTFKPLNLNEIIYYYEWSISRVYKDGKIIEVK